MSISSIWYFEGQDAVVDGWFFMRSPYPVLLTMASYLYFVLRCGPKFMRNRQAYQLRNALLLYNVFQVTFSSYIVWIGVLGVIEFGIVERGYCNTIDMKQHLLRLYSAHYLYLIAKMSELLDTMFFVLRKKPNQITFLHVYHHTLMVLVTWFTLKYQVSYSFVIFGLLNAFVHVIMYTYYGLSAFPNLKKYLWWKKYITKIQLTQFFLMLIHSVWNWQVSTCPIPNVLIYILIVNIALFVYLFLDFYVKRFIKSGENDVRKNV